MDRDNGSEADRWGSRSYRLIPKGFKDWKKRERKKYSVNRFADEQEYSKSIKEGDGRLTSGTTKLMAISSWEEEGIKDSEDRWGKSLLGS